MKYLITLCVITLTLIPNTALTLPDLTTSKVMDGRAFSLGKFFEKYKCPSFNYELIDDYINAADQNNLDYRLLASISVLESQCGKIYPRWTSNIWGWNSARSGFDSMESGVDYISGQLAHGKYYRGKTLDKKLNTYCPTILTVNGKQITYAMRIQNIMNQISN